MSCASPSTVVAQRHLRCVDYRVVSETTNPTWIDPSTVRNLEWRRQDETWWHTAEVWPDEMHRSLPATIAAWATAHGVPRHHLDDITATPSHDQATAFDRAYHGVRATLVDVEDLRPIDWDTGKALPLPAEAAATCARCAARHAIVWTVTIPEHGEVRLGSTCAQRALGLKPAPAWRTEQARRERQLQPFLVAAGQRLAAWEDRDSRPTSVGGPTNHEIDLAVLHAAGFITSDDLVICRGDPPPRGHPDRRIWDRIARATAALSDATRYRLHGRAAWFPGPAAAVHAPAAPVATPKPLPVHEAFQHLDAARDANRDGRGRIQNEAMQRRLNEQERELAITSLGLAPEGPDPNDRYVAPNQELRVRALEAHQDTATP